MRRAIFGSGFILCGFMSACQSGASGDNSPVVSEAKHVEQAPVSIKLIVPPKTLQTFAHSFPASGSERNAKYVSASTLFLRVTVSTSDPSRSPLMQTFPCTVGACVATFPAPVGNDSVALALADAMTGGNVLALTNATPINVRSGTTNTFSLIADGVVDHVKLTIGASSTPAGTPATTPITVEFHDADDNSIIAPGTYIDASGNPVTVTLGVNNASAGGAGTVTLSASNLGAPGTVTASYNGGWFDHATISVVSPANIAAQSTTSGAATFTTTPTSMTLSPTVLGGASFQGITFGPDGKLWAGDTANTAGLLAMSTTGVGNEFIDGAWAGGGGGGSYPVTGPDGAIWFSEFYTTQIGRVTTSGVFNEYGTMTGSNPVRLVNGPDGNIWFSEESAYSGGVSSIGKITPSGTLTDFAIAVGAPRGIGLGPDQNFWVVSSATQTIGRITPTQVETDFTYTVPWAAGAFNDNNDSVVEGSDGNMWFITPDEQGIAKVTVSGTVAAYHVGSSSFVTNITRGVDGNIWFVDNSKVGRITPTGTITEYATAATGLGDIVSAPDGTLYTTNATGNILKFVY